MPKTVIKIGPADHGRRMTLQEFGPAEVQEGSNYELGRGVIVVSDIPKPPHFGQLNAIRLQLTAYQLTHPGRIYGVAGGAECKVPLEGFQSERHPDVAVYKTAPPSRGDEAWETWVPEIVIEIVSPGSQRRDYEEKPEEYLAFGVREYWIIDAEQGQMTVVRRVGGRMSEKIVRPPQTYRTRLLPGFELDLAAVLRAAG